MNAVKITDPIEYVPEGSPKDNSLDEGGDEIPF